MFKIRHHTLGALHDYAAAPLHDQGIFLQGSQQPPPPYVFGEATELHTPRRSLALKPNLGDGLAVPFMIVDHLPRPRAFQPMGVPSVLPATPAHAPFAAAVGALASLPLRGGEAPSLGAELSVVASLSAAPPGQTAGPAALAPSVHALAAGFFRRRSDTAKTAHRVPVVIRDTLPTVGNTPGIMALPVATESDTGASAVQPRTRAFDATYPLLQKAYAQLLRGDERSPGWDPHAATAPEDTSTAASAAHALLALTGCQPTQHTVRGDAPASRRLAQAVHLSRAACDPEQAMVLIPHGHAPHTQRAVDDAEPLPQLRLGDHAFVPGMPLIVVRPIAAGLALFDPLRSNAQLYSAPTVEQLLHAEQTEQFGFLLTEEDAQQARAGLDFPQRFAQTVPGHKGLLSLTTEQLRDLDYTVVALRPRPRKAAKHLTLAAVESVPALLSQARLPGVSHDAQQGLLGLLARSRWQLDPTHPRTARLMHRGRSLISVTPDDASRMFRTATCETPRPLIEHLLALPEAALENLNA